MSLITLDTTALAESFRVLSLKTSRILPWIIKCSCDEVVAWVKTAHASSDRKKNKTAFLLTFEIENFSVLCETGTERIQQVVHTAFSARLSQRIARRFDRIFYYLFVHLGSSLFQINAESYLSLYVSGLGIKICAEARSASFNMTSKNRDVMNETRQRSYRICCMYIP